MESENSAPDIYFTPAPDRVIAEMLRLADVSARDVVFDLGCGDGRIVIAAASEHGARGVGIDIDPQRLREAGAGAAGAGVEALVEFRNADIFTAEIRDATVIALYLLDSLNVRLRPRILAECQPGTRVVSYSFEMGEWTADAHTPIAANGVSLWYVPARLAGTWTLTSGRPDGLCDALHLSQEFQMLTGNAIFRGNPRAVLAGRVRKQRDHGPRHGGWGRNAGRLDGWAGKRIELRHLQSRVRGGHLHRPPRKGWVRAPSTKYKGAGPKYSLTLFPAQRDSRRRVRETPRVRIPWR